MKVDGVGIKIPKTIPKKCVFTPKYEFLTVQHCPKFKKHRPKTKTTFSPCYSSASVTRRPKSVARRRMTESWKNQHNILHYFGHNFWTVTPIRARFEALESLFNALYNNEKISTKLMIFYAFYFEPYSFTSCSKSCAWSHVFDTLLLMLQISINTYKINGTTSKCTLCTQKNTN